MNELDRYLAPSRFLDVDDLTIARMAREAIGDAESDVERAKRLFRFVRDGWRYDPYSVSISPVDYMASRIAAADRAYCIPKALLLAALARSVGIPARLGFADVKNHLASKKLLDSLGTDLFAWHGYTELYLGGRWVKATPAFNRELCERFGVEVLEFDGVNDAIFQSHDREGARSMEYVSDRGTYDDLPFEEIMATFADLYGFDGSGASTHDAVFHGEGG